jgi:hypothetical protein
VVQLNSAPSVITELGNLPIKTANGAMVYIRDVAQVRDGNPPTGESSFYSTFTGPAIYTDAAKFHKIKFKDIEEVITRANTTDYGLAAAVWTRDIGKAHAIADRVRAGTVWVNCYDVFDANTPFGGFKDSGIGREGGVDAVREYMEPKSVWISTADDVPNPFVMLDVFNTTCAYVHFFSNACEPNQKATIDAQIN